MSRHGGEGAAAPFSSNRQDEKDATQRTDCSSGMPDGLFRHAAKALPRHERGSMAGRKSPFGDTEKTVAEGERLQAAE